MISHLQQQHSPETEAILQPVVVGYGHAGRNLHAPAIHKVTTQLAQHHAVRVLPPILVDPSVEDTEDALHHAHERPGIHVVHIVTPPETHVEVLEEAIRQGHHAFLMEKPAVVGYPQLAALRQVLGQHDVQLLVVANWLASHLTERLHAEVYHGPPGRRLQRVHITQSKPRFNRSVDNASHLSAFEVEMPHMMTLAHALVGNELSLQEARCSPLHHPSGAVIPHIGGAWMRLLAADDVMVTMESRLDAPMRERHVDLHFSDGSCVRGYFPCDSADHHSQLHRRASKGADWEVLAVIPDDTFATMLSRAYSYFAGLEERPRYNIESALQVCEILADARIRSGIT